MVLIAVRFNYSRRTASSVVSVDIASFCHIKYGQGARQSEMCALWKMLDSLPE